MRVMSRPGRITMPGHIMTIVRNVVSAEAVNGIGRVRMLDDRKAQKQVSIPLPALPSCIWRGCCLHAEVQRSAAGCLHRSCALAHSCDAPVCSLECSPLGSMACRRKSVRSVLGRFKASAAAADLLGLLYY